MPELTGCSCKVFPFITTRSLLLLRRDRIRSSNWFKFVKKTSMPNPLKSFECIKWYRSSWLKPIKSSGSSVRHNCQKLCKWMKRPESVLQITEFTDFLRLSKILLFQVFQCFSYKNRKQKKTNKVASFYL